MHLGGELGKKLITPKTLKICKVLYIWCVVGCKSWKAEFIMGVSPARLAGDACPILPPLTGEGVLSMNIFEKVARRITRLSWNHTVHHIILEAMKRRIITSEQGHAILGAWNAECFPERGHASFLKVVEQSVRLTPLTVTTNPVTVRTG